MSGRFHAALRRTPAGFAAGAIAALVSGAYAAPAPAVHPIDARTIEARIEPALLAHIRVAPADTALVWITFADKGERDAADLATRLAAAEAALTPRARARRVRAHVSPLVDARDLPVPPEYLAALEARGLRPFAASRWLDRVAVRAPGETLLPAAMLPFVHEVRRVPQLRRSPDLESERARLAPPRAAPQSSGAAMAFDYGLNAAPIAQLRADALHDSGYTGAGVLIAVLDEGFNAYNTHAAFADRQPQPGYVRDFVDGDTTITDLADPLGHSHGTMVLGCIVGHAPGAYLGTAFDASVALARTEDHDTERPAEMLYWTMGAEWADSLGADVLSSSLGYFTFDPAYSASDYVYADMNGHTTDISRGAEIAASKGILLVNSVGNEGNGIWHYLIAPSDVNGDSLIAVGAVDAAGAVASFSSFGPSADGRVKPDLAARGVSSPVVSADGNPNDYETASGTSFSAPLVAGLAACLLEARPAWTPTQVIRALRETASRAANPDTRVGYGIPNGRGALYWGMPNAPAPPGHVLLIGPNPLRADGPPTQMRFTVGGVNAGPMPAHVRVFDTTGREVRTLWSGALAYGDVLDIRWDGRNAEGARVRPGLYYVALAAGGDVTAVRIVALQ